MADAGERGSDEAQQEKGNRVKGGMTAERAATILASAKKICASPAPSLRATRADSLRAHQLAARFGLAARHPLCQAALDLWFLDAKLSKAREDAASCKKMLNTVEQEKKQAKAELDQFYEEEGKQKEVIEADAYWHKMNDFVPRIRKALQAANESIPFHEEMRFYAGLQFGKEFLAIERTKMKGALRALSRVQKRWKAFSSGKQLKYGELRELGILQLLQDKKIKAESAKGGAVAAYMEAWFGGDRLLSDDEWQGRLTAREIHSHLAAAADPRIAGDKDAKEIRRLAKRLGFRLAEDQPGRKWKEPRPKKQEPKKQPGRPRIHPEIVPAGDTEGAEGIQRAIFGTRVNTTGRVLTEYCHRDKFKYGNTSYGGLSSLVESARKETAAIEREINKLRMLRGGRKGKFVY